MAHTPDKFAVEPEVVRADDTTRPDMELKVDLKDAIVNSPVAEYVKNTMCRFAEDYIRAMKFAHGHYTVVVSLYTERKPNDVYQDYVRVGTTIHKTKGSDEQTLSTAWNMWNAYSNGGSNINPNYSHGYLEVMIPVMPLDEDDDD